MNIKSIIAIGLTGCSLLGGSIYAAGTNNKNDNSKSRVTVTIPAPQSNSSKDKTNAVLPKENVLKADSVNSVKKNQQFYAVLSENASTGYTWNYKTNSKAIQLIDEKNILPSDKNIVGAPSQKVWTFKAAQTGTYKLQFSYARSWEKHTAPAKTVVYTVNTTSTKQDIREIAFNQMTSKEKGLIGNWQNGKLSKVIFKKYMGKINNKTYIGKEVYLIDFSTTSKILPSNIIVYVDINSNKLIGYGYVD